MLLLQRLLIKNISGAFGWGLRSAPAEAHLLELALEEKLLLLTHHYRFAWLG